MREIKRLTSDKEARVKELCENWTQVYGDAAGYRRDKSLIGVQITFIMNGVGEGSFMECEKCGEIVLVLPGNIYDTDACDFCGHEGN